MFLTPSAALGGGEASDPAPPALQRRKPVPSMAMLTPAFLCSCFCLGSRPDMRWGWPCALGSQGSAFCSHQRRLMCPSCEQGGGYQLHEGLCATVGPCLLQVMYFSSLFPYVVLACFLVRGLLLRGAVDGILHMFTPKVKVWEHPQLCWAWSASCSVALMEDLLCVRHCIRLWRDVLGTGHGPCPQGSKERYSTSIWVKSEASGRR